MKKYFIGFCIILSMLLTGVVSAQVAETMSFTTQTESYIGLSEGADPNSSCWVEVFNRPSTDAHTELYLYVDIDGCIVPSYQVYTIKQGSNPVPVELNENDIMIVWDEDATHGETPPEGDYDFTGTIVVDPNCPYIRVRTNDQNDILNWSIHRVVEAGTLTISNTGYNEHDVIMLQSTLFDLSFTKEDDVEEGSCATLDDTVVYTICYENNDDVTLPDCYIIDLLPYGMTYPGGDWTVDPNMIPIPPDPAYDPNSHSYYWYLGDIGPGDSGCVELEVVVNEHAEPGFDQTNIAELYSGDSNDPNDYGIIARAIEETPICCWGDYPNTLFVDLNATGNNTGVDWQNAYNTKYGLKKALHRARFSTCTGPFTIYIAQGTYLPGISATETFELPDETEIYGGFPTGGCDFAYRNPKKYETILSGWLDASLAYSVVEMGHESLLDGVTVNYGVDYNIVGYGVDFEVNNCEITDGLRYGIYAEYGNMTVKSCLVKNNSEDGIYHESIGQNLNVSNSWIMRNDKYGVFSLNSTPVIKNSIISESDLAEEGKDGIHIENPFSRPVLHNLTVSNNKSRGIYFEDNESSDPNSMALDYPDIQNCIVYYNNNNARQMAGFDPNTYVSYSCVQNCAELNNNINDIPKFAYTVDPLGAPDPENYHLAHDSLCKDSGNPSLDYTGQVDYDNEVRVAGTNVDRGADELYSCDGDYTEDDFANEYDWSADGIVNLEEFSIIAGAWLTNEPNSPAALADPNSDDNWNEICNLDDTGSSQYSIDLADLAAFVSDVPWLWKACWYDNYMAVTGGEMVMMSVPAGDSLMTVESVARTVSVSNLDLDAEKEVLNMYETMTNNEVAIILRDIYYLQDCVSDMLNDDLKRKDKKDLQEILVFFDDELAKIKESLQ